jgi:hypothetical protein
MENILVDCFLFLVGYILGVVAIGLTLVLKKIIKEW